MLAGQIPVKTDRTAEVGVGVQCDSCERVFEGSVFDASSGSGWSKGWRGSHACRSNPREEWHAVEHVSNLLRGAERFTTFDTLWNISKLLHCMEHFRSLLQRLLHCMEHFRSLLQRLLHCTEHFRSLLQRLLHCTEHFRSLLQRLLHCTEHFRSLLQRQLHCTEHFGSLLQKLLHCMEHFRSLLQKLCVWQSGSRGFASVGPQDFNCL